MKRTTWRNIWERKYRQDPSVKPHVASGFDNLNDKQWEYLVNYFLNKLNISEKDDVLEVGCGCGAFLRYINNYKSLSGIDYSANSIDYIRKQLNGNFYVSEAAELPFADSEFNIVLSFSVFFYFESYDYARNVIQEMIRVKKKGGKIFIGDVSDIKKYDIAQKIKNKINKKKSEKGSFVSPYTPKHLYYDKDLFRKIALENNLQISFIDENVKDLSFYSNSKFRYSVLLY